MWFIWIIVALVLGGRLTPAPLALDRGTDTTILGAGAVDVEVSVVDDDEAMVCGALPTWKYKMMSIGDVSLGVGVVLLRWL